MPMVETPPAPQTSDSDLQCDIPPPLPSPPPPTMPQKVDAATQCCLTIKPIKKKRSVMAQADIKILPRRGR